MRVLMDKLNINYINEFKKNYNKTHQRKYFQSLVR